MLLFFKQNTFLSYKDLYIGLYGKKRQELNNRSFKCYCERNTKLRTCLILTQTLLALSVELSLSKLV